ncbi:MAG TPA: DUF1150 domain-containing protein [Bauldia sp.]|nr:DUF1150 domain-containing protein [Bauldia sp.]
METTDKQVMPPANFAVLGGGKIAYIRVLESEKAKELFPGLPPVDPGVTLFALLGADGTPIMLADSREAVIMNAHENDLETMSIH